MIYIDEKPTLPPSSETNTSQYDIEGNLISSYPQKD